MSSRNQKKFNTIVKRALKNGWKEEDLKECIYAGLFEGATIRYNNADEVFNLQP